MKPTNHDDLRWKPINECPRTGRYLVGRGPLPAVGGTLPGYSCEAWWNNETKEFEFMSFLFDEPLVAHKPTHYMDLPDFPAD